MVALTVQFSRLLRQHFLVYPPLLFLCLAHSLLSGGMEGKPEARSSTAGDAPSGARRWASFLESPDLWNHRVEWCNPNIYYLPPETQVGHTNISSLWLDSDSSSAAFIPVSLFPLMRSMPWVVTFCLVYPICCHSLYCVLFCIWKIL